MAPAGSPRIVEHREQAQGARSPVDLRRRSRHTQGFRSRSRRRSYLAPLETHRVLEPRSADTRRRSPR
eukprot:6520311-Prymnesium_polylepis.1